MSLAELTPSPDVIGCGVSALKQSAVFLLGWRINTKRATFWLCNTNERLINVCILNHGGNVADLFLC